MFLCAVLLFVFTHSTICLIKHNIDTFKDGSYYEITIYIKTPAALKPVNN